MVTLSVTRSRVAKVLRDAASLLEREGWDPRRYPMVHAIDEVAGFFRPGSNPTAEETTIQADDALTELLGLEPVTWEQMSGRTQAEVLAALRTAADEVVR